MSPTRAYRPRRRPQSTGTRERIVAAVGELLEEGVFHEATVEEVADRAGVARATLYQHFGSRLGLVDAVCETIAQSPELRAARGAGELADVDVALGEVVGSSVRFWAAHERLLEPLYGVAAVDPAAARLVERQRRDRTSVLARFARRLHRERRLAGGVGEQRALALLLVVTSFETYLELRRHAGLAGHARAVAGGHLSLRETAVSDMQPVAGMPLEYLDCTLIPTADFSALSGAPLASHGRRGSVDLMLPHSAAACLDRHTDRERTAKTPPGSGPSALFAAFGCRRNQTGGH